ncbi:hypothetical protein [Flavobacterium sp. WC2430]|uniref:RiboL-PSP-HEPN domain-containing protein n=2 Tax=unclassified Flavobacterium TaxID=196869 RepID=A0AB39W9B1_9FLAO
MGKELWKTGPKELLKHGLEHLSLDTEFDYRMSMILIDNSVELMMKTYLGLPKRITKIEGVTRKVYEEATSNFPNLVDAIEKFAENKLIGIELGEIEWFHKLRNQLYHDGNGITVEKEKVIAYSSIAKILFENLFDEKIELNGKKYGIDDFLLFWTEFNKLTIQQGPKIFRYKNFADLFNLTEDEKKKLIDINNFRNKLVHNPSEIKFEELNKYTEELKTLILKLRNIEN